MARKIGISNISQAIEIIHQLKTEYRALETKYNAEKVKNQRLMEIIQGKKNDLPEFFKGFSKFK